MGRKNGKRFHNYQKKKPYVPNKRRLDDTVEITGSAGKAYELVVKNSLKEDQAGITEYIKTGEGFKGILKSRFSDFHVNEIDLTGQVLHLNDSTIPDEKEDLTTEEAKLGREKLKNIIAESVWDEIHKLFESKSNAGSGPADSAMFIDATDFDKEQRTLIHKVIKKLYGKRLLSTTVKGDLGEDKDSEKKHIRIMKAKGRDRNEWNFPKDYVHFLVHKENMDTGEIAATMAKKLNMKPSLINYSGTKDKRGKTTQKFSIKKRTPRQIAGAIQYLKGVVVGNFHFKDKSIKLGDLVGNRFRIAIRNLIGEKSQIETSLNNVNEYGFINYFGLQRFGNCSTIPTYEIGIAILKADYKLACELIMKPRESDIPFLHNIRETWWKNRDSKAAAALFHSERFIEKKLLDGLAKYGENDYAAALTRIPRNMLLLYPHAFQSLIFNKVASKRIKEFGLKLIPGDLVYRNRHEDDESTEVQEQEQEQEEDNDVKEAENESCNVSDNIESTKWRFKGKVKCLTKDDIESGVYTIFDVVLTLPGYHIAYPDNVVGSWYKEFMEHYDLSSEKLKHKMLRMRGAYRKMVVKPRDMSWEYKTYSSPDETLILSDFEMLQGKTLEDFKGTETEAKYEALLLDFCLPAAGYATMLLRELLKCDTSTAAQSILQQAAAKEHAATNESEKEIQNKEEDVLPAKILKLNEATND